VTGPNVAVEIPDRLLTTRETSEYLRVSIGTLYRIVKAGWLEPVRVSAKLYRFRESDLRAYDARNGSSR
jgi:excisionase family DNA binding protein